MWIIAIKCIIWCMLLLCDICPYNVMHILSSGMYFPCYMTMLCVVCPLPCYVSLLCDVWLRYVTYVSCYVTYVPFMWCMSLLCDYNVPAMWRMFLAMWRMFLQYDICAYYGTYVPAMLRMSLLCNVCFLLCDIIMCLPMWDLYLVWNQ